MKRCPAVKIMVLACLAGCMAAGDSFAQALVTLRVAMPHGVNAGWSFPAGRSSHLGLAALLVSVPSPVRNQGSGVWFLLSSDGNPVLKSYETYRVPVRVASGDVDGDDYQDMAVLLSDRPAVSFIIGKPDAAPQITEVSLPAGQPTIIGIGDLTSDGLADLVVADSSLITILARTAKTLADSGAFQLFTSFEPGRSAVSTPLDTDKILFGDFDGNQRQDFILRGFLYLNLSGGRFVPKRLPDFGDASRLRPLDVVADFDADRKSEYLFAWKNSATSRVQTVKAADYDPVEVLRSGLTFNPTLPDNSSALILDYDLDGLLDLELFTTGENSLRLYRGTPAGINTSVADTLFADSGVRGNFLCPFDLGNDGQVDWVFWNSDVDSLYVRYPMRSFADGTAANDLDINLSGQAAAVGDYDNDGDLDIFVVNFSGDNLLLSRGADGSFTDAAVKAGVARGNDGVSCAWGDYDNDGWADLFVAGLNIKDKLFRNNGDGTFADSSQILRYDRGRTRATSASWGDVNRDGYIDLLIGNFDGPNWLLINRNGRYFEDRAAAFGLTESYRTESAVLVDVNLDGRLDILTLNENGPARLLLGTISGTFVDSTATSGLNPFNRPRKFGQSQSWGDFNGDGYPDLYITRIQDEDMLLLNRGRSQGSLFQLKYSGQPEGEFGRMYSAIADFNSDGLPDLLVTRTSSVFNIYYSIPKNVLVLNDPAKLYPDPAAPPALNEGSSQGGIEALGLTLKRETALPLTGDFDADGDLDLLYVNYLPDNQVDLFHGSNLQLIYMVNQVSYGNSVIVQPKWDTRSAIGTRVVLHYGGRSWLQTVSGGSGRIQTAPYLLFNLGYSSYADSLTVYWPDGEKSVRSGPIYTGTLELTLDRRGPLLQVVEWPGGRADGYAVSGPVKFSGKVTAVDNSSVARLGLIVRHPLTGTEDTTLLETPRPTLYEFSLDAPAPGDSLYYYFEGADVYGNRSRLPASSGTYLKLVVLGNITPGDVNGDGRIDTRDFVRLFDIIQLKGNPPTLKELLAADLNSDGKVDILDVLQILKLLR